MLQKDIAALSVVTGLHTEVSLQTGANKVESTGAAKPIVSLHVFFERCP
jgi:hypothetical protein